MEVKERRTATHGSGFEAVTAGKRRRLLVAARHYASRHGLYESPLRFDVVSVDWEGDQPAAPLGPGSLRRRRAVESIGRALSPGTTGGLPRLVLAALARHRPLALKDPKGTRVEHCLCALIDVLQPPIRRIFLSRMASARSSFLSISVRFPATPSLSASAWKARLRRSCLTLYLMAARHCRRASSWAARRGAVRGPPPGLLGRGVLQTE